MTRRIALLGLAVLATTLLPASMSAQTAANNPKIHVYEGAG